VTEEKISELEGVISESEARKKPKTSVTEGKLFTDAAKENANATGTRWMI
jgi:hypothetical protein